MTLDLALDYLAVSYTHYFNLVGLGIATATFATVRVLDEITELVGG